MSKLKDTIMIIQQKLCTRKNYIMSNKLSLIYDKRQNDFVAKYPTRKVDGNLLLYHLVGNIPISTNSLGSEHNSTEWYNFKEDLEKRGYDITTLRFSIKLKKDNNVHTTGTRTT